MTLFRRNNDVIIALCVRWDRTTLPLRPRLHYIKHSVHWLYCSCCWFHLGSAYLHIPLNNAHVRLRQREVVSSHSKQRPVIKRPAYELQQQLLLLSEMASSAGNKHIDCKDLHRYLRTLSANILDRLYGHPATCLAVFRWGTTPLKSEFSREINFER